MVRARRQQQLIGGAQAGQLGFHLIELAGGQRGVPGEARRWSVTYGVEVSQHALSAR